MGLLRYCLLVLLLAKTASANDLDTIRATLKGLQGRAPLSGSAEFEMSLKTKDSSDIRTESGRITLGWSWINDGLAITFPRTLLERSEEEQRARRLDPEVPTPTRTALLSFSAIQISDAIDFGRTLLRELERAELVRSDGTMTEFRLPPRLRRTEQKHVRDSDTRLRIWRGADGVPVRTERTIRIKASFFFIRFENNLTDHWTLTRRGDRLVATRHEGEESTSGLTRSVTMRTTTVLTVD